VPDFRYTLDYERTYHDLGLVQPGEVRNLRKAPDEHWRPVQHKAAKAPQKTTHPAPTADTPTSKE
jgi:hypothetical protein